ncbi:MAG TPA: outer membrane beta-barrel protein [Vicinamibacterales bacterium]|nr:outer membrane beta-barrel protein [Vicinamibacterales bacterium]
MDRARSVFLFVALLAAATASPAAGQPAQPAAPATASPAQTAPSGPLGHLSFGATFEGYYQFNWNRPPDRVMPLRAYDTRSNVFSIQQTAIVIESAPSVADGRRFGARVDLQFGQATETVQGNGANEPRPDAYRHLWQAYGTYVFPVGRGLQADFGKFASNLGYETNYAKDNNHFSRAYLFNFLPFYHMGVRLTLPVSDKVTLMYALTNGIQQTEDFNTFKSSHVTAIIKPVSSLAWTTSYYAGREQPDGGLPDGPDGVFRVIDSYVTYTASPKLTLGVDANYVTNEVRKADESISLQGTGAYARYQVSAPAAVSLRYERLDDEGLFGGIEQVLQEFTATFEHKFADGFLARAEFRRDWSNVRFFPGSRSGNLRRHQNTALVGLVWWFGNKSGAW